MHAAKMVRPETSMRMRDLMLKFLLRADREEGEDGLDDGVQPLWRLGPDDLRFEVLSSRAERNMDGHSRNCGYGGKCWTGFVFR
jgi:hypothetical protein